MYIPEHFRETDLDEIAGLMRDFPLACLVAQTAEGLVANHLPLLSGPGGVLIGHVARANDLHRLVADGQEVLAVFRGEEGYITPQDYPSKAEHHRAVPTWNYRVAHVQGRIRFQHDLSARRAAVGLLTRDHERRVNGAAGWRMADAPADYMATMLAAIVAFRIEVSRVLAKSKLSQNRSAEDRQGAAAGLERRGEAGLATAMTRRGQAGG